MKFVDSLLKIATRLFNESMSDRYRPNDSSNDIPSSHRSDVPKKQLRAYYAPREQKAARTRALASELKGKGFYPKFQTAPGSPIKITPPQLQYYTYSKNTPFSHLSKHIIANESQGKFYKSLKANTDGTYDYGLYQINDLNLSRGTSGGKLADAWDPIFSKYYDHYQKNFAGKNIGGVDYKPLKGDSLNIDNRRKLLQIKHTDFNSPTDSLSYDLSKTLYDQRGIGQWATKEKIIKDYEAEKIPIPQ